MEHWIASIFHVADLHLFVDEQGDARPIAEQHASVSLMFEVAGRSGLQWLKNQVAGFSLPNMSAWTTLRARLPELVQAERGRPGAGGVPILVLQTGDVDTFGRSALREARGLDAYPGFACLRQSLWPAVIAHGADAAIDLYGNHDVWAGTWPMLTPFAHVKNSFERIARVSGLEGPWPDRRDFPAHAGYRLEVYRVNTVSPYPLSGSLASGSIRPHPPGATLPRTGSDDVFRELFELTRLAGDTRAHPVRIVAMHHPPHFFGGTLGERITSGHVAEADGFARCLSYSRIHLVVAGHRHELDPSQDVQYDGREPAPNQSPLNSTTGQVVAESPTASSDLLQANRNSLCLYRFYADDAERTLRVTRSVLRYRDGADVQFRETRSSDVFRHIPLQ